MKVTRREQFLAEMDAVVRWARLLRLIEPHYPRDGPKGGRQRMPLEKCCHLWMAPFVQGSIVEGQHIIADLSLPYCRTVHDYIT